MQFIKQFLKQLQIPKKADLIEKKEAIRLCYPAMVKKENIPDTDTIYIAYRSVCRGVFGFWISRQRPGQTIDRIEIQGEMF